MKIKKSKFIKFFIVVLVCLFGVFGTHAIVNADTYYEYEENIEYEFSPLWEIDFINIHRYYTDLNYIFKPNHTYINGDYSTNVYSINSTDYMPLIYIDLPSDLPTLENTFYYLFDNQTFYSLEGLRYLYDNNWYSAPNDLAELCDYNDNKFINISFSGLRLIYAFDNFYMEGGNILSGWNLYDNDFNLLQTGGILTFNSFKGVINSQNYVINFDLPYYPLRYNWDELFALFIGNVVITSSGYTLENKYIINEYLQIENLDENYISIVSYLEDFSMVDSFSFIIENQYIRMKDWNNFSPEISFYLLEQNLVRTITIADGILYKENGSAPLGISVPIVENFDSTYNLEYVPVIPAFNSIYGNFTTNPNDIIYIEKMVITFTSNDLINMEGGTSIIYRCPSKDYYKDNYTDLGTEIINRVSDDNLTGNLANSINDFLAIEILPGLSFYGILLLAVAVPLLIWILKIFFGG